MASGEDAHRRFAEMGCIGGSVTLDQGQRPLPVDSMGQIELAQALDRLERSGVSVEVDEELTAQTGACLR